MTMRKRVIWAGNRFYDRYLIIKNNRFKDISHDGGTRNCYIEGLDNVYQDSGCASAQFLLSEKCQDSAVNFGPSVLMDESFINDCTFADWLHIAYIDALPNLDLSKVDKTLFKVISCDFCEPKTKIVSDEVLGRNLEYCDYIFNNVPLGNGDTNEYDWRYKLICKTGACYIYHDEQGGTVSIKDRDILYDVDRKGYIFTIGAGDRFAAAFIEARLQEFDIKRSQEFAHKKVGKWLEEVNRDL